MSLYVPLLLLPKRTGNKTTNYLSPSDSTESQHIINLDELEFTHYDKINFSIIDDQNMTSYFSSTKKTISEIKKERLKEVTFKKDKSNTLEISSLMLLVGNFNWDSLKLFNNLKYLNVHYPGRECNIITNSKIDINIKDNLSTLEVLFINSNERRCLVNVESKLEKLKYLSLSIQDPADFKGSNATYDNVKVLVLYINDSSLGRCNIDPILAMFPNLSGLCLSGNNCEVNCSSIEHLDLQALQLVGSIKFNGLLSLENFKKLKFLCVAGGLESIDLESIYNLDQLEYVMLGGNQQICLEHFSKLENKNSVNIIGGGPFIKFLPFFSKYLKPKIFKKYYSGILYFEFDESFENCTLSKKGGDF